MPMADQASIPNDYQSCSSPRRSLWPGTRTPVCIACCAAHHCLHHQNPWARCTSNRRRSARPFTATIRLQNAALLPEAMFRRWPIRPKRWCRDQSQCHVAPASNTSRYPRIFERISELALAQQLARHPSDVHRPMTCDDSRPFTMVGGHGHWPAYIPP